MASDKAFVSFNVTVPMGNDLIELTPLGKPESIHAGEYRNEDVIASALRELANRISRGGAGFSLKIIEDGRSKHHE